MSEQTQKTEFLIHDNRGRPFKIVLHQNDGEKKLLDVFVGKYLNNDEGWDYSTHFKTFEYEDIFIGQGMYDSTDYCDFSYGNAVLISLKSSTTTTTTSSTAESPSSSLQYVYIGQRIVQFTAEARIEKFVSTIGNQDVPYSYARDCHGNHYFFQATLSFLTLVDVVRVSDIPDEIVNGKPLAIYRYYYDHCDFGKKAVKAEGIVLHHDRHFG